MKKSVCGFAICIMLLLSSYYLDSIFKAASAYVSGLSNRGPFYYAIGMGHGQISFTNYLDKTTRIGQNLTSVTKTLIDRSGIPLVEYGYKNGIYIGSHRNPVTISHFAIDYYSKYKKNVDNSTNKEVSLNNSNWLVSHAINHGNYSLLEYDFPWPDYNLTSPWRSGLTQAQAIVAMVKAHELTGDKKYLDTAKMLLNSFFVEVKDGGVTYKTPQNGWWYEEYAGKGGKEPRVLNGMMFTVIGINSYYRYTDDKAAKYLFDQGIIALKKNLPRYNIPSYNYSYYDSLGTTNPLSYHKIQIDLLSRLYDITHDRVFKQYHDRWVSFKSPPYIHEKMSDMKPTDIYS